jgi:hypothetical protein
MKFIKIILTFFLLWNNSVFSQSESKSQSEIRNDKKIQVAGFIYKNDYYSILLSYNLNASFTVGIDARQVKISDREILTNASEISNTKERDSYLFLQWFPFKAGGLYLSARMGYYKVTVENENWYLKSLSYSNFNYEFNSMNLSKLMYGGGIGYRWVFAKRLSINVKLIHPNDHWETHIKMEETQDSLLLMNHLTKHFPTKWKGTLLRVGVVLSDLVPDSKHQISLFEDVPRLNLMKAIDKINIKYGIEAVGPGSVIAQKENKEPKIAFQRVPGLDEFES